MWVVRYDTAITACSNIFFEIAINISTDTFVFIVPSIIKLHVLLLMNESILFSLIVGNCGFKMCGDRAYRTSMYFER